MYALDAHLTHLINATAGANGAFDLLVLGITLYLAPFLVIVVAAHWWVGAERAGLRHTIVAAGLSFGVGLAVNQLILLLFDRARPYLAGVTHLIVEPSTDPSFPSDHATATAAIAAAFLFNGSRMRGLGFAAAALMVSLSRVYVGTHYVSDIVGGAATGILAAWIVTLLYRRDSRADRFIVALF